MNGVDVLTRGDALECALQARDYLVTCGVPAALADMRALRRRGLPVVWLHLRDPVEGSGRLAQAVRATP